MGCTGAAGDDEQLPTPPPPKCAGALKKFDSVSPAPAPAVLPRAEASASPRRLRPPAAGRICGRRGRRGRVTGVGRRLREESRSYETILRHCEGAWQRRHLPVGCPPPPRQGERIWRVLYDDDGQDYDTPERFLSCIVVGAVVEAAPEAFGHDPE